MQFLQQKPLQPLGDFVFGRIDAGLREQTRSVDSGLRQQVAKAGIFQFESVFFEAFKINRHDSARMLPGRPPAAFEYACINVPHRTPDRGANGSFRELFGKFMSETTFPGYFRNLLLFQRLSLRNRGICALQRISQPGTH